MVEDSLTWQALVVLLGRLDTDCSISTLSARKWAINGCIWQVVSAQTSALAIDLQC